MRRRAFLKSIAASALAGAMIGVAPLVGTDKTLVHERPEWNLDFIMKSVMERGDAILRASSIMPDVDR